MIFLFTEPKIQNGLKLHQIFENNQTIMLKSLEVQNSVHQVSHGVMWRATSVAKNCLLCNFLEFFLPLKSDGLGWVELSSVPLPHLSNPLTRQPGATTYQLLIIITMILMLLNNHHKHHDHDSILNIAMILHSNHK